MADAPREDGSAHAAERQPEADGWAHLAFCPNCASRLEKRQCKACCLRCGFFQDCSDTIV